MSAEIPLNASGESFEFPYRAMSSTAIASVIFAFIGLLGGFFFWPMLGICLIGALIGFASLRKITRFPEEFDGKSIAVAGIALNMLLLAGGAGLHSYIYLTEVPDGYTRVHFWELQQPGELDQPTTKAFEIDGEAIFLKGYIHPSSGSGLLKRFILVPDLGTCCFGGQPKSSDMIEVTLIGGDTTQAGLIKKKLAGTFVLNRAPQKVTDFDNAVFYRMQVDIIR
ncbi:MAG: DUF4190 domain-containing protein [Planctomycetota bacterium]